MTKCLIDCDFHTHTGFSDDCSISMDDMVNGAISKGIKTLAITDHHDPGYPDPEFPFLLDFDNYHKALEDTCAKYEGIIDIRKGIEMGIMAGNFEEASRAVNTYDYDFVIGSFHCTQKDDMYRYDFESSNGEEELVDFYNYMYQCLKEYQDFDIVGHFTVLDRYIGKLYDYKPVEEVIDEILKLLIRNGKGLEINSSSFKYGTGTWLPRESVLRRYIQLGGEILTFGSDAHDPKYYQDHFNDVIEFAKSIGFKSYCTFKNRQAEFHKLP